MYYFIYNFHTMQSLVNELMNNKEVRSKEKAKEVAVNELPDSLLGWLI